MTDTDDDIVRVRGWLRDASAIAVLTGAGISTDSGIPDFRGPSGVWTKNPAAEKKATLQNYVGDAEVRKAAWRSRLDSRTWAADPNDGHRALVRLEQRGNLAALLTQNVDGLHHEAGSSPGKIVEIHGTVREVGCLSCTYSAPMQTALDRVRAGEQDPDCPICGGMLKSSTISFGQSLIAADLKRAEQAALDCDVMVAIGTTLAVYPDRSCRPARTPTRRQDRDHQRRTNRDGSSRRRGTPRSDWRDTSRHRVMCQSDEGRTVTPAMRPVGSSSGVGAELTSP